ncbi:MAG: DUF6273 domain-containing protein [Coriobacteriales bacterium]|jgi:hypothetical protein|nr:DUF6273 domain-containing protein [Coriobacteriales bacterium]
MAYGKVKPDIQSRTKRTASGNHSRTKPAHSHARRILVFIGIFAAVAITVALLRSALGTEQQEENVVGSFSGTSLVSTTNSEVLGIPTGLSIGEVVSGFGGHNWLVLDIREGKALIITQDYVSSRQYNDTIEDASWSDCSLRRWLNTDFIDGSFAFNEKSIIASSTFVNDGNAEYGVAGCEPTTDKLFLLSISEAEKYELRYSLDGTVDKITQGMVL